MSSPYENLPPHCFWKSGVGETTPETIADLYKKKFPILAAHKIATAGSCFAQHIARYMRAQNFAVMDVEPAPRYLPREMRHEYGYDLYSARYGNIYTARQLLQLAQDAQNCSVDPDDVWLKEDRYYDALRPSIEPKGFDTLDEALANRRNHLERVRSLFQEMDIFVFTFGLTEAWLSRKTGRVYPTAPGTIAGDFDATLFEFRNFGFNDVYGDFVAFRKLVQAYNPDLRFLVTVSPVPLTATATDEHVLVATTYSKSVLRSVAGALAMEFADIDYVPSYEIIASPWSKGAFYESNLRTVTAEGVSSVMRVFFAEHGMGADAIAGDHALPEEKAQKTLKQQERHSRRVAERAARRGTRAIKGDGATVSTAQQTSAKKTPQQLEDRRKKRQTEVCEDILLEAFSP